MKIELLTSHAVPCTQHTASAGMRFDVVGQASAGAVWIRHRGGLVFVEAKNFREVDRDRAWLAVRACVFREPEFLPQITQISADGRAVV